MEQFRAIFPLDESETPDGDVGFIGVNMRLPPEKLPPGVVSEAKNMRFNRGKAEPRRGNKKLAWTNQINSDNTAIVPFKKVRGVGIFSDPDDIEWVIIAADDKVYRTREDNLASAIPLPAGVVVNYPVFFVQALGELLMFRGDDLSPLRLTSVDVGFESIVRTSNTVRGASTENPTDGTSEIPNAENALFIGNRVFVPYGRDFVAVSDFLNYTRYQPVRSAFRVNQGSADWLVGLFKFNESTLIAAKESSIHIVYNVRGNLSQAFTDELTRSYGTRSPKSFKQVGRDVWFLADRRGVVSIAQTEENKLQAIDLPVSDAIQPLIDRINWRHAAKATAEYIDNKYYLAVPLDSARVEKGNMLTGSETYTSIGSYRLTVKKGRSYRWVPGANEKELINGTETVTAEADFTAQGDSVVIVAKGVVIVDDFNDENGGVAFEQFTGFKNWNVTGGNMDLYGNGSSFDPFPSAKLLVDTRGNSAVDCVLESKSTFSFQAGVTYYLKYKMAGTQRGFAAQTTIEIGALFTGTSSIASAAPLSEFTQTFTPGTNANATVKITSVAAGAGSVTAGHLLDDISVADGNKSGLAITAQIKPVFDGVNTAVLVFDFVNKEWAGYDTAADLMVQDWLIHTYNGVRRLFYVSEDGFINLYEEDFEDEVADKNDAISIAGVDAKVITRGYIVGDAGQKRLKRAGWAINTWDPKYSVTAQFDGAFETKALRTAVTKSRTKYYKPFDKADYVATNVSDDHATKHREDYSVNLADSNTEVDPAASGIDPEVHQQLAEMRSVGRPGRYCQLVIENNQGRCEVQAVVVTAAAGPRRGGNQV